MLYHELLAKIHQEEILREANHLRLISQAQGRSTRRNKIITRILAWSGRNLSKLGDLLQERYGETSNDVIIHHFKNNTRVELP